MELATSNLYTTAQEIVENYFIENNIQPEAAFPTMGNRTNRYRAKMRPSEPDSIDFNFTPEYFPDDFFIDDIRHEEARHLLFATKEQLDTMRQAKTWYMDGTFHIVKSPFVQLYSIHVMIVSECGEMKQVPVAFAFMSRRRESDYFKIFQSLLDTLGDVCVERCILGFERGTWKALRELMPAAELKGCAFHWQQAIFRKVASLGMEVAYCQKTDVYKTAKKLMALPYLHYSHITEEFFKLKDQVMDPAIKALFVYAENQWICSATWPVQAWMASTHQPQGRKKNVQFFLLVQLLHKEATFLPAVRTFVLWSHMRRRVSKKSRTFNANIEETWMKYEDKR